MAGPMTSPSVGNRMGSSALSRTPAGRWRRWTSPDVAVLCVPLTFTIGGTVSGLDGTVVLDNGSDTVNVSASGAFAFGTPVAHGGGYDVTVGTQPDGQQCAVNNGTGTVESAEITDVAVTCVPPGRRSARMTSTGPTAIWVATGAPMVDDGPLSISSGQFLGRPNGLAGDIRDVPSESYDSDQYSQIEVTANSIGKGVSSNGQWIGAAVRAQNGGQDTYLGPYFWNNGNPVMMLFKSPRRRVDPTRLHLCQRRSGRRAPALKLMAVGNTISFRENGDPGDLGHRHEHHRRQPRNHDV